MNDFKRQWADTRETVLDAVERVGASGWYVLGDEVRLFEAELSKRWPLKYAVGVASGLDALEISLRLLGCKAGDRVLVSPISAFATVLAVVKLGAVPVFVDSDQYGLISLEQAETALRSRPDIRFMVPVHLYGHALSLNDLRRLRETFDLRIVEDCAQSILSCSSGAPTGSVGQLAATSFYPTKNLGAMGDGGAILTNDEKLAEMAKVFRDYGQTQKYRHTYVGYNSRLDELQAAILRQAFLNLVAQWTERRREIAASYERGLRSRHIMVPGCPAGSHSSRHLFPVLVSPEHKQHFLTYLKQSGIGSGEHYPLPLIDQPAMREIAFESIGDCPTARRFCQSEVSLPMHPYLSDEEVQRVICRCNEWEP